MKSTFKSIWTVWALLWSLALAWCDNNSSNAKNQISQEVSSSSWKVWEKVDSILVRNLDVLNSWNGLTFCKSIDDKYRSSEGDRTIWVGKGMSIIWPVLPTLKGNQIGEYLNDFLNTCSPILQTLVRSNEDWTYLTSQTLIDKKLFHSWGFSLPNNMFIIIDSYYNHNEKVRNTIIRNKLFKFHVLEWKSWLNWKDSTIVWNDWPFEVPFYMTFVQSTNNAMRKIDTIFKEISSLSEELRNKYMLTDKWKMVMEDWDDSYYKDYSWYEYILWDIENLKKADAIYKGKTWASFEIVEGKWEMKFRVFYKK